MYKHTSSFKKLEKIFSVNNGYQCLPLGGKIMFNFIFTIYDFPFFPNFYFQTLVLFLYFKESYFRRKKKVKE